MDQDPSTLKSHIIREMTAQGLTLDKLAHRAGLSRVTLWRLLNGKTEAPRRKTAHQVARALGLSEEQIRETISGQYEMLPVIERLPEDDHLFAKALRNQLAAVPEPLRLQAVRAAITAMAGVMHQTGDEGVVKEAYTVLRDLDMTRWLARQRMDRAG